MLVLKTQSEIESAVAKSKKNRKSVGFIPTMGALHEGHLSLVRTAIKENDISVCSIFVNPKQFDNPADLQAYPNSLPNDLQLLESVGCDIVFVPDVAEIYPADFQFIDYDFHPTDSYMEGEFRKGHFQGMANVVKSLLNIVGANAAYFGEKDFQQLQIIKELVDLENIKTKIIPHPIIREEDGLAMSSRNKRLSKVGREKAPIIFKMLQLVVKEIRTIGYNKLKTKIEANLEKAGVKIEYFEICHEEELIPLKKLDLSTKTRAFIAVYIDEIRLIDNQQIT